MSERNLWVLLLQDQARKRWDARCLTLGISARGKTRQEAARALQDAVLSMLEGGLDGGPDPFERPSASEEHWARLYRTLQHGRPLVSIANPEQIGAVAAQLHMNKATGRDSLDVEMSPLIWQLATLAESS